MSCSLEELLGINRNDPLQKLAADLVASDEELLDRLVEERKRNNLTQAVVAERMGISQGAVARIESGERDPRLSTLRRYAHAVRTHVAHTVTPRGVLKVHWDAHCTDDWGASSDWHSVPKSIRVPVR